MSDKVKEIYMMLSPTKGEDDFKIYTQYTKHDKRVDDIAFEFNREPAAVYRAIDRVETFLKSDISYYDINSLELCKPMGVVLHGVNSLVTIKIAYMALSMYYTMDKEYLDEFYCHFIQNMHPNVKNKKKKIVKEIKDSYWYFFDDGLFIKGTKIKIFDSFNYSKNRIDFTINELAKRILWCAKIEDKINRLN